MNYLDDSGLRRLTENERMKLLREEEQALGLWQEYHLDETSYPEAARVVAAKQEGTAKEKTAIPLHRPVSEDGSVGYLEAARAVSV